MWAFHLMAFVWCAIDMPQQSNRLDCHAAGSMTCGIPARRLCCWQERIPVVSEVQGHASITITVHLYSHVLPDMQREATSALDELLRPRITSEDSGSGQS
jgi:hypothetical protein